MSLSANTVCIAGVGYAVPATVRPNSEILKAFPHRTEEEMVRLTGIRERRYAAEDESATDLAKIAVQTGRPLRFDPKKQRFIDDKKANAYISEPMRGKWKIKV